MVVRRRGFSYEFDERVVPPEIGEGFAEGFEEMGFGEGQTVQVGWMVLSVVAGAQGLELHEPDMSGALPIRFVPGITRALVDTMRQRYVTDSVGLTHKLEFPSLVQSVLVCNRLESDEGVFVHRADPPEGHASGWICCCVEKGHDHNDPNELRQTSLYDLACQRPEVVEFLGMPIGSLVALRNGERPVLFFQDQKLDWAPGSYLQARFI